jgi:hypothetical protein
VEELLDIARTLLAAGGYVDAPAAVKLWGRELPKVNVDVLAMMRARMVGINPPESSPCSTLCLATELARVQPPLAFAAELRETVAAMTAAPGRLKCPRCKAAYA